jgi:cyclopropane-fatty-acyl-phospholipid synthase
MFLIDRFLRGAIRQGELTVIDHDGSRHRFGSPDPGRAPVVIRFADPRVEFAIIFRGGLGVAEAFMDGRLVIEEGGILELLDLVTSNARWEDGAAKWFEVGSSRLMRAWRTLNWAHQSRRNVAHHYDLSDRLYDLFLDADRQYSCAYFAGPDTSLEQAQLDKKAHIAAKLHLEPGQRVLDIGCGWGGLALYLNRVADVDVLGITLSVEQLSVAQRRAEEAGVADRVRFQLRDYRHLEGQFDRIVSVGMFEHVGPPNYGAFFNKCRSLMTTDGVMLLHTIGRYGPPGATDAFTRKYIFPGGYIPALSEMMAASEKELMIASDIETLRLHYGLTTAEWYRRTTAHREEIVALYDERFFRMWQFYLAGATITFRYGGMGNYQLQYIRDRHALPITRDYMLDEERRLKSLESESVQPKARTSEAAE